RASRNCRTPTSLPTWSTFVVTNSLSRNSGIEATRPKPASFAALRGHVSTSLPPCATSARSTLNSGSVPFCAICSTTLLEPRPMTGSISPVLGIGRSGMPCCSTAASAALRAKLTAATAALEPAMNPRRVVVCFVMLSPPSEQSVGHRVHDEVRAHAKSIGRRCQRVTGVSVPLPEVCEVVVVQRDDRDLPDGVDEAVVDGVIALDVRRHAVEALDLVNEIEDRVVDRQTLERAIRKDAPHLLAQVVHVPGIEVVDEDEAAALDVLAQVRD